MSIAATRRLVAPARTDGFLCPEVAEFESYMPPVQERVMQDSKKVIRERAELLFETLSKRDNAGGSEAGRQGLAPSEAPSDAQPLTNAELARLQTRVIALENLVIALLADASDWQLELARQGAAYIRPRPGHTPHPLTINAADQMDHLVQRSTIFRAPV
jgi:hypothetical protein